MRTAWIATLLPLAILYLLALFDVPLGQPDYLVYRYSPLVLERLVRCLPAWVLGAVMIWIASRWERPALGGALETPPPRNSATGGWCIAVCWVGMVAWTFWAPPDFVAQHMFNLNSPAQDGAFVWEAGEIASPRGYLSEGFARRLALKPEDMRGTRVLSNPPATTMLAYAARRTVESNPWLRSAIVRALDWYDPAPSGGGANEGEYAGWPPSFPTAVVFGLALTAIWGLTLPAAYALVRAWLPPAGALAVALACAFNPSSLNFTPGKDPAQSLLVVLLLLCALRSYRNCGAAWAALFGALLTASIAVSLVFVWIGLILLVGTGWHAARHRRSLSRWCIGCVTPAAVGALSVWIALRLALGFDVAATAIQVARRYPDLQRYLIHGAYTLVGFPVFLLFAGPMFWVLMTRKAKPAGSLSRTGAGEGDIASLGSVLARVTVACMVYCYFFANNNESARLWLPFLIMLMVFMSMSRADLFDSGSSASRPGRLDPLGSPNGPGPREEQHEKLGPLGGPDGLRPRGFADGFWQRGLADGFWPRGSPGRLGAASLMIAAQIVVTTLHAARMDARESEWRMLTGRNWD